MNIIVLAGKLARDAEVQLVGNRGSKKANLLVAVDDRHWDQAANGFVDEKINIKVEVWNSKNAKPADEAERVGRAGVDVILKGKMSVESWVDKNTKETKSMQKIKVEDVTFLCGDGVSSVAPDTSDVPF